MLLIYFSRRTRGAPLPGLEKILDFLSLTVAKRAEGH
jgi:hypothetical protein